jgi:LacI family transcriptional regulator
MAEQVANENGYSVIICLSDDSFDKEVLNMEMLANGALMDSSPSKETNSKRFSSYFRSHRSRNACRRHVLGTNEILCDKVIIDDKQAAYEAVQSLIDKGKENRPCHHC